MQNMIVAEIESHVTYAVHADIVFAAFVGEEHKVAAFQVAFGHGFALHEIGRASCRERV